MDVKLIYENNAGDRVGLMRGFQTCRWDYLGDFREIVSDGRKMAMLHGTD